MILGLLGIYWVMAYSVYYQLLAWEDLSSNKALKLISLTILWVIWKERNNRAFEGVEQDFNSINDKWFHYFGYTVLGHNLECFENLGSIVNILIDM